MPDHTPQLSLFKICPKCGESKFLTDFGIDSRERHGRQTYCKACRKAYRDANSARESQRATEWARNNMDRHMEKQRRWARRNPDKARAVKAATAHKNRKFVAGQGGEFTANEWLALCAQYDNRCVACGNEERLTVDHVVPVSKGGSSNIANIQPLCESCNRAKGVRVIDYRPKKRNQDAQ